MKSWRTCTNCYREHKSGNYLLCPRCLHHTPNFTYEAFRRSLIEKGDEGDHSVYFELADNAARDHEEGWPYADEENKQ